MKMRRNKVASIVCALVLCAGGLAAQAVTPAGQTLPEVPHPVAAPDFELKDLDGVPHKLTDYRGKVVVLNFWATWCPPCRYEMPSMQRGWEKAQADDIVFLGVNVGEDADTVFMFLADYSVEFPLLLDMDAKVIKQYQVVGLPTTYIIDPQGRLTHRVVGSREWDDAALLNVLRGLLPKP
ncbi:MAG: TlpA family protein disulfide reductase [Gammaproteobacteria bacterium]|nr:TlpA family protein disulfide reductase [Gammaproteobacteria bacterium]